MSGLIANRAVLLNVITLGSIEYAEPSTRMSTPGALPNHISIGGSVISSRSVPARSNPYKIRPRLSLISTQESCLKIKFRRVWPGLTTGRLTVAGNAATTGNTSYSTNSLDQEEQGNELSLYNFKLVGIISGSFDSYVSLVNATGEVITLGIFEELSDGVKLVDMRLHEAVFQKSDGTYLVIDFRNQIVEKDEY